MTAVALEDFVLQSGLSASDPVTLAGQLLGIGIAAATAAGLVAVGYRWYVRERVPTGLGVLFGLSVVTVYLGTTGALGAVISDPQAEEVILQTSDVLPNLAAFALGAAGSSVGIRVGDAIGTDLFAATGGRTVDADVSEIVQTVGRVGPHRDGVGRRRERRPDAGRSRADADVVDGAVVVEPRGTRREYELISLLRRAGNRFRRVTLGAESDLAGQTLRAARVRETYGVAILAVRKLGGWRLAPRGDTELVAGEELYVVGTRDALDAFEEAA